MAATRSICCISLALGLALAGCGAPARPVGLTPDRGGLVAELEPGTAPTTLTLRDATADRVIARVHVPAGVRRVPLPYPPRPDRAYEVTAPTGVPALYAAPAWTPLTAAWHVPAGARAAGDAPVAVATGSALTVALTVTQHGGDAREAPVRVTGLDAPVERTVRLYGAPDETTLYFDLTVPAGGPVTLRAHVDGDVAAEAEAVLVPTPVAELAATVELVGAACPTNSFGTPPDWAAPDVVSLPHPWVLAAAARLGLPVVAADGLQPIAYQRVRLRNRADAAQRLTVRGTYGAPGGAGMLPMFEPAPWATPSAPGTAPRTVELPPGGTGDVLLPIYVQAPVRPGTYERRVQVSPAGSAAVLHTWRFPLGVVAPTSLSAWTVVVGAAVSLLGGLVFVLRLPRLARARGIRALTMVALIGATTAVASVFANGVLGTLLNVVFGPFNQFVAGFVDEFLQAALVVTAVVLLPRPGTAALTGTTAYLIVSLLFQGLGALALLTTGLKYTLVEALLWLFGTTRTAPPPTVRALAWWRCVLAFALADAAALYVSFALFRVFYRLYFASWFVFLSVAVAGVLYTWIGGLAGVRLAHSLRWAQR